MADVLRARQTAVSTPNDLFFTPTTKDASSLASLSSASVASVSSISAASMSSLASASSRSIASVSAFPPSSSFTGPGSATGSGPGGPTPPSTGPSSFPFTTTVPFTTVTSASTTLVLSTASIISSAPSSAPSSPTPQIGVQSEPICLGDGIDASALGVLVTALIATVVGFLLWLLFSILRPRIRRLYGIREWFVAPELRPPPLRNTLWAFLFPPVPLIPDVPTNVADAGSSPQTDAELFPSDEQLSQRTLWVTFLIVLGWSILALITALPMYLVSTPCLAQYPAPQFGGRYSTLHDLSLLRLLHMLDEGQVSTSQVSRRAIVDGADRAPQARVRLIILTVLLIVFALLPALFKLFLEFKTLAAYRMRWLEIKCEGVEMGYLSARSASGFIGWGEGRLKDFLVKNGLSAGFDSSRTIATMRRINGSRNGSGNGSGHSPPRGGSASGSEEKGKHEIDVQGLFTVCETDHISELLHERDVILNNLEIAEARYIASFQLSTPSHSLADFNDVPPSETVDDQGNVKLKISRPRALTASLGRRRHQLHHRTFSTSIMPTPTSYVAPSSYYKLRGVQGVSGGRMGGGSVDSLGAVIRQRVIGTRFQEMNRDSNLPKLPIGSHLRFDGSGELQPVPDSPTSPTSMSHGPNHAINDPSSPTQGDEQPVTPAQEYRDSLSTTPLNTRPISGTGNETEGGAARPRPAAPVAPPVERRDTFPMRNTTQDAPESQPLHLRVQRQAPFVRPVSGLDHDHLGAVYADIRTWRSRLKAINADIADSQAASYKEIADGVGVKGWILIGRGVRFLPGVELIEGRTKEDVRWRELQYGGGIGSNLIFWSVVIITGVILGATFIAISGLYLAGAPNVAHYLPFLQPIANSDSLGPALATTLVPAVAATLFIVIALALIQYAAYYSGSISVSRVQLNAFKATFYVLVLVAGMWLVTIGGLIFSMNAFDRGFNRSSAVADGSVYAAIFLFVLVINAAIIAPALMMIQPFRLWRLLRRDNSAITPRQHFRAMYPQMYNPSFAIGCCILGLVFVAAFAMIFPLIGLPVIVLVFLTLVAHRYLIGYVFSSRSYTGGLLQLWILRRFATLLALQPLLLGLIVLSRRLWGLGGVLVGIAFLIVVAVEIYAESQTRLPGVKSLSPIVRESLNVFKSQAKKRGRRNSEEMSATSSSRRTPRRDGHRTRTSIASVLDMMSVTLAVMPSASRSRGPVPLQTEELDDLVATERAARTHPDAPPRLPPLPFADHAEEMAGILYPPELLAPPPIIWLPNDSAGIAQSEAYDLQRYHDLRTTIDVRRAPADPTASIPRHSTSFHEQDRSH